MVYTHRNVYYKAPATLFRLAIFPHHKPPPELLSKVLLRMDDGLLNEQKRQKRFSVIFFFSSNLRTTEIEFKHLEMQSIYNWGTFVLSHHLRCGNQIPRISAQRSDKHGMLTHRRPASFVFVRPVLPLFHYCQFPIAYAGVAWLFGTHLCPSWKANKASGSMCFLLEHWLETEHTKTHLKRVKKEFCISRPFLIVTRPSTCTTTLMNATSTVLVMWHKYLGTSSYSAILTKSMSL